MKGNCGECERRWACEIDPNECNEWPDLAPMTNAQKIRSMSDDELEEFLWNFNLADVSTDKLGEFGPHMLRCRLKEWLQMPAEEDDYES